MLCQLKSCAGCSGDLVLDEGDWRCVQCGRYYYTGAASTVGEPPIMRSSMEPLMSPEEESSSTSEPFSAYNHSPGPTDGAAGFQGQRKRAYRPRSARSINSVIQAKARAEARWWERNRQIIGYLDQGLPTREISQLTHRGQRQIRTVREKLTDFRTAPAA